MTVRRALVFIALLSLGGGALGAWLGRDAREGMPERFTVQADADTGTGTGTGLAAGTRARPVGRRPAPQSSAARRRTPRRAPLEPAIAWRRSRALGSHTAGRLVRGVRLPAAGRHFVTWDPVRRRWPNRAWRRWGTDRLVRTVLRVLRRYRHAHPDAARVAVGDLSRPRGGDFGRRYGPLGHASHQNGLDVDVYYPRRDRLERKPFRPAQVDRQLAQELVDAFVAAGAERVFVGPALELHGPPRVVQPLPHHDDHLHVRLPL